MNCEHGKSADDCQYQPVRQESPHCTLLDQSNNPGTAGEHENGAAQASLGTVLLDRSNNSLPQDAESASMNAEQVTPCAVDGEGPSQPPWFPMLSSNIAPHARFNEEQHHEDLPWQA